MQLTSRLLDLSTNRLEYHYRPGIQGGSLPPVLFLHPWRGCWQFWLPTIAALPGPDCYSLDLYSLGVGDETRFASPVGLADATVALIDALGIERCTLVGNSMGGLVSQLVAARLTRRVENLVLIGTSADRINPVVADISRRLLTGPDRETTRTLVAALFATRPTESEMAIYVEALMRANKTFMAATSDSAFALDLRPLLPMITARTLIVRGELDQLGTREQVRVLLDGISESEAIEIRNAGHSPQVDTPAEFAAILDRLIGNRASS